MSKDKPPQQSKVPLTIAIAIPVGSILGLIISLVLKQDSSFGLTAGGLFGLSIGLIAGVILDTWLKTNHNNNKKTSAKHNK